MEEKILAIIPARSGSKGLKDKNIKDLNGKPLIAHTIEVAKKSNLFSEIIVSTDSERYAEISREYGAIVPFLRSEELSSDAVSSTDVILDVLKKMEDLGKKYDSFILLQPTSPLRTIKDLQGAYKLYQEKGANAVISVCEMEHSPLWSNTLPENLSLDNFLKKENDDNRQRLPIYYRLNGAIYISNVKYFTKYKDFYCKDSYAYIMSKENSIDIDDELDFNIAKYLIKFNKDK